MTKLEITVENWTHGSTDLGSLVTSELDKDSATTSSPSRSFLTPEHRRSTSPTAPSKRGASITRRLQDIDCSSASQEILRQGLWFDGVYPDLEKQEESLMPASPDPSLWFQDQTDPLFGLTDMSPPNTPTFY